MVEILQSTLVVTPLDLAAASLLRVGVVHECPRTCRSIASGILCSRPGLYRRQAPFLRGEPSRGVEQAGSGFRVTRVSVRRYDRDSERVASRAGPPCAGADSRPCWPLSGRVASLATGQGFDGSRLDHLCSYARDVSDS